MTTYNITILVGGGVTITEIIEASKYSVSKSGMIRFLNQEGNITHVYPATRIYFTIGSTDTYSTKYNKSIFI